MKNLFIAFISLFTLCAIANDVEGTLMLKGSLKSKVTVNGISSVCKLKINKVKNILEEDDFGYPGYEVQIEIALEGKESDRKVKFDKKLTIINMFNENGVRRVKDLEYFSAKENVTVQINREGRLLSTTFPYGQQTVKCSF